MSCAKRNGGTAVECLENMMRMKPLEHDVSTAFPALMAKIAKWFEDKAKEYPLVDGLFDLTNDPLVNLTHFFFQCLFTFFSQLFFG